MKTKHTIYITASFFLIVSAILVVFLAYPALKDIESISQDILSKRIEAASMDFQNRELDNFKNKYAEYAPILESISQSFVDVKNPVNFITFLEKTANDLAIDFDINLNTSSKKEGAAKEPAVMFQVFAKGKFSDILVFSETLERGPYLVIIKNVSMKKTEEDILSKTRAPGIIDANFLIEVVSQ